MLTQASAFASNSDRLQEVFFLCLKMMYF